MHLSIYLSISIYRYTYTYPLTCTFERTFFRDRRMRSAAKMLQNRRIQKQEKGRLKTQAKKGTPKAPRCAASVKSASDVASHAVQRWRVFRANLAQG